MLLLNCHVSKFKKYNRVELSRTLHVRTQLAKFVY
jgi:hypothetical protein